MGIHYKPIVATAWLPKVKARVIPVYEFEYFDDRFNRHDIFTVSMHFSFQNFQSCLYGRAHLRFCFLHLVSLRLNTFQIPVGSKGTKRWDGSVLGCVNILGPFSVHLTNTFDLTAQSKRWLCHVLENVFGSKNDVHSYSSSTSSCSYVLT